MIMSTFLSGVMLGRARSVIPTFSYSKSDVARPPVSEIDTRVWNPTRWPLKNCASSLSFVQRVCWLRILASQLADQEIDQDVDVGVDLDQRSRRRWRCPSADLITSDPCCSSAVSVFLATRAFSLSSVSHRVGSELSCTPSEVMF